MGKRKMYAGLQHHSNALRRAPCNAVLIVLGIASSALSKTTGGTDVQDFFSGILMGLSVVEILAGICVAGKTLLKQ